MSHPVSPHFADYLVLRARRAIQGGLRALLLAATLASICATAQTCLTAESESNNTDSTADTGVGSGTAISGRISSGSDVDWYRLDVTGAGTLTISLAHASNTDLDWYLYPATGAYMAYGGTSNNLETGSFTVSAAGTYYLRVRRYAGTGDYTLTVTGPLPGGGTNPPPTGWPCTLPGGVNLGRTDSATDVSPATSGGFALMGGGTDVDNALRWMIGKSGGGDVVVLRSSGTNAYNSYIYGLGTVNSVTTLLVDSTTEGDNACVAEHIRRAEMLFIAGGDQQNYICYFKSRAVGDAINHLVNTKRGTGAPERLTSGQSLTWDLNNQALQVFAVRGTTNATNTFNFSNFTSNNATIEHWSADNGVFTMQ